MIERRENIKVNFFKIKNEIIHKIRSVYKFSVYKDFIENQEKTIYNLAYKKDAIVLKDGEYDVISYIKPDDREFEVLSFNDLNEEHQKKLLLQYLNKNFINKLNEEISKNFLNFPKYSCIARKNIEVFIEKINNDFYIAIDLQHSIESTKNLWDYCNRNIDKLIEFKNKNRKVKGKSKNSATIKRIIPYSDPEYQYKLKEEIISYYEKKGEKIQIKDLKQPIVEVIFSGATNPYTYLAEHLFPVITIQDLGNEIDKFRISNKYREKYLANIVKNKLNEVLEYNPLNIECVVFNPLKVKSKSINGNIKVYEDPKSYFVENFRPNNNTKDNNKGNNATDKRDVFIYKIPEVLKGKVIPVFLIADLSLEGISKNSEKRPVKEIKDLLIKISSSSSDYPIFEDYSIFKKFYFYDLRDTIGLIENIKAILSEQNYKDDKVLPLVITIGREKDMRSFDDYYQDLKGKLLRNNFIHQHIIYEHIISRYGNKNLNRNFEVENLVIQILAKYGIYPYVPDIVLDYDYVVGLDVGNDKYGDRKIGGAVSVFNKNGLFEAILPVYVNTGGEKLDVGKILETIHFNLGLKDKNILLIRDGNLYNQEIEKALEMTNRLSLRITFMNVIKKHNIRMFEDESGRKGIILKDNFALLLNHKIQGARPIKITSKIVIENGHVKYGRITEKDLWHLYALSHVNYSNIHINTERFRYPAPIHYADKFVKSLGKDFRIREDLLNYGYLYFL